MTALKNTPNATDEAQSKADKLWMLLDEIDTLSDSIKPRHEGGYKAFYDATIKLTKERFKAMSPDAQNAEVRCG